MVSIVTAAYSLILGVHRIEGRKGVALMGGGGYNGGGYGSGFALLVVLFILLIIVGAAFLY